nr:MAG TPA: hypothetical protein [Caudoviricetes sp.]
MSEQLRLILEIAPINRIIIAIIIIFSSYHGTATLYRLVLGGLRVAEGHLDNEEVERRLSELYPDREIRYTLFDETFLALSLSFRARSRANSFIAILIILLGYGFIAMVFNFTVMIDAFIAINLSFSIYTIYKIAKDQSW